MEINWVALTIIVIWLSATMGTYFTGDVKAFDYAFWATLAIGVGYLIKNNYL